MKFSLTDDGAVLVTPREAVEILKSIGVETSTETLKRHRMRGDGPPYVRQPSGRIAYEHNTENRTRSPLISHFAGVRKAVRSTAEEAAAAGGAKQSVAA